MTAWRSIGARPDATRGTVSQETRRLLEALVTGPGVLPGADDPLVEGTAGWAYVVHDAAWATRRAPNDGLHVWGNAGDETVDESPATGAPLPATAPGSGLERIDIIWVRHLSTDGTDETSQAQIGVTAGIEAATAVAPAIPAGALEIARNTMTSEATNTSGTGNTLEQTAPAAALRTPDPVPYAMYVEQVSMPTSGTATAQATVTWPAGRFSVAPRVVATCSGSSTGEFNVTVTNVTASSALVTLYRVTGAAAGTQKVDVMAVQMASGAAEA